MRGALFYACLFFFLLKGLDSSGAPCSNFSFIPAHLLEQPQQISSSNTIDSYSFIRDVQLIWEEHLIVDDYDDEKNNRSLVLRQPLLLRRDFTLPEAFLFNFQYGFAKDQLNYFGHLPDICITQRSLRI